MSKTILALPQTEVEVDGVTYLITAMPASVSLEIVEELMKLEGARPGMALVKRIVCGSVSLNGADITAKTFDIIFSRKTVHLYKLVDAVIQWNMEDVFTSGTEEQEA